MVLCLVTLNDLYMRRAGLSASAELLTTRATHSIARSLLRQRVRLSVYHTPVLCVNDWIYLKTFWTFR